MGIANNTALITGAARGIGFPIAKVLHDKSIKVMIADRENEAVLVAAKSLGVPLVWMTG